eukprot:scaffold104993_cov82-Phaeocystis_antarctica.AAC.2
MAYPLRSPPTTHVPSARCSACTPPRVSTNSVLSLRESSVLVSSAALAITPAVVVAAVVAAAVVIAAAVVVAAAVAAAAAVRGARWTRRPGECSIGTDAPSACLPRPTPAASTTTSARTSKLAP